MDCISKWFTAKESAEYMGMHLETVYRFLQRKELRSVKTGRTYRVKPEWCDAFLTVSYTHLTLPTIYSV